MIDLKQRETEILCGLKDFQKATVERVYHLLTNGHLRVLVADEVGLGKTLVARGVIAKLARYHKEKLNDDLFKVVYVCSNQNIANQNLKKLKVDHRVTVDGLTDTRLSMQHLKIFEDKYNPIIKQNYIQLIPLTPTTSFHMTLGCGSVTERALIFAIIKRYSPLKPYLKELDIMMMDIATKSWKYQKEFYEERVSDCNEKSNHEYLNIMLERIDDYFNNSPWLLEQISDACDIIKTKKIFGSRVDEASQLIQQLRKMMAEISVDLIDADLVIMDEFQRFPELINADSESETALLASKFFNSIKPNGDDVSIVLLSATPYKPYSTMEEIAMTGTDEHYKEFKQVTNFLFEKHNHHNKNFNDAWNNYSKDLGLVTREDFPDLLTKKQVAEDHLYKGIARTERLQSLNKDSNAHNEIEPLIINEEDVLSYVKMDEILKSTHLNHNVPVEYVKSAPFLMSFMEHYKLKQNITNHFKAHPHQITSLKSSLLWIDRNVINKYGKLNETNARLSKLKESALPEGAERLLWVPPSLPYYELDGPFKNHKNFSKALVFSAWEMVPRAISALVSYEAERRTVGKLIKTIPKKKRKKSHKYFAESRFPHRRLIFNMRDEKPANMNHLTLLYPSPTLANLFNPIDVLNQKLTLAEIKNDVKDKLEIELNKVEYIERENDSRPDESWYYMAPLLFDLKNDLINDWFSFEDLISLSDSQIGEQQALAKHFEVLRNKFKSNQLPILGKQPDDLLDNLVDVTLGSPAVCSLRMINNSSSETLPYVVSLAKQILDRFNTNEATAIVDLEYRQNKNAHWQRVLQYSIDGNIQAMLDEYAHMLLEEGGLYQADSQDQNQQLLTTMTDSLSMHTSTHNVDTYESFKKRISNKNKKDIQTEYGLRMRANYAVGFYDTRNENKTLHRKENLRLAFNSPFRPFVLATTSVGQEGLDFHYYCRKIIHWNLPSNPIDLEQREGRINRYKCHNIRQNIAYKYKDIAFSKNIWNEMFQYANETERNDDTSELVPFWSLTGKQKFNIKKTFPLYPLSRDGAKYRRLMKVLNTYRLSLGQPRQEDLLEYLDENDFNEEQLKDLFMNLSPYFKNLKNKVHQ